MSVIASSRHRVIAPARGNGRSEESGTAEMLKNESNSSGQPAPARCTRTTRTTRTVKRSFAVRPCRPCRPCLSVSSVFFCRAATRRITELHGTPGSRPGPPDPPSRLGRPPKRRASGPQGTPGNAEELRNLDANGKEPYRGDAETRRSAERTSNGQSIKKNSFLCVSACLCVSAVKRLTPPTSFPNGQVPAPAAPPHPRADRGIRTRLTRWRDKTVTHRIPPPEPEQRTCQPHPDRRDQPSRAEPSSNFPRCACCGASSRRSSSCM
jgi:hypothetical protein